jgi:hypothetical protein
VEEDTGTFCFIASTRGKEDQLLIFGHPPTSPLRGMQQIAAQPMKNWAALPGAGLGPPPRQ